MRALIVDDHDLMRDGLRLLVGELGEDVTIDEASSLEAARAWRGGRPSW